MGPASRFTHLAARTVTISVSGLLSQINPGQAVLPRDGTASTAVRVGMDLWRLKMRELVRALCVVALIFLNFGHVPLAAADKLVVAPLAASFCGYPIDGPAEDQGNPCQACRIGGSADLPPPCAETTGLPRFAAVAYPEIAASFEHSRRSGRAGARAPPAV
jgi:hypothetical protein